MEGFMSEYVEGQGFDIPEELAVLADKKARDGKPLNLKAAKIVVYNDEGIVLGTMPTPKGKKKRLNISINLDEFPEL